MKSSGVAEVEVTGVGCLMICINSLFMIICERLLLLSSRSFFRSPSMKSFVTHRYYS